MPKHKLTVYNPKINEYIYDILSSLRDEQKKYLSSAELKLIMDNKRLRWFVTWSSLEKKLSVLTKVGIDWNLSFIKNPEDFKELVAKVYKQHTMKKLTLENIEELRSKGIFVIGNKQYALSLTMLAQNCNSDYYFLNKDFIKVRNAVANATSSKQANPLNPDYIKSEEAFALIAKVAFEAKMAENYIQSDGLQMVEYMILLFLYQKSKTYVQIDVIQRALYGEYTARTVYMNASVLFTNGYIDKLPSASALPAYTITAKGIMFIGRVLHRIVNSAVNT